MSEIDFDLLWPALCAPQIAPHISRQLHFVVRTLPPHCVCLDVLIEQLVRVKLGTVSGQKKEVNLSLMPCQPAFHPHRDMDWMSIYDQEDFPFGVPDKPSQK